MRTAAEKEAVEKVFSDVEYVTAEDISGEIGFLTGLMTEAAYEEKAAELGAILQMIRVA